MYWEISTSPPHRKKWSFRTRINFGSSYNWQYTLAQWLEHTWSVYHSAHVLVDVSFFQPSNHLVKILFTVLQWPCCLSQLSRIDYSFIKHKNVDHAKEYKSFVSFWFLYVCICVCEGVFTVQFYCSTICEERTGLNVIQYLLWNKLIIL